MTKALLLVILSFSWLNNFAQEDSKKLDLKLYVFDTYADFLNDKGRYVGVYSSYSWSTVGTNNLWVDDNKKKVPMKNMWGFKIGDFVFRMGEKPKIPLTVIKKGEKIFYIDGYIYLNYLKGDDLSTTRTTHPLFYSDDLNTEIYEIEQIIEKEKGNAELKEICDCVEANKKTRDIEARFNANVKCVTE